MYDHVSATSASGFSHHALPFGGQEPIDTLIKFHPLNHFGLAASAMQGLMLELNGYGLTPSTSMTRGLQAVAGTLEAMAEGSLPPQVHLSSLDPGVGKTTLIKHFIMALLASPPHEDVAVLVCFSRLEEVHKMQASLEVYRDEVAIWTGDPLTNDMATTAPNEARVLLTTQQKVEAAYLRHSRFDDISGFHYLDLPRDVRIWDESLLPGKEILLSADDLSGLLRDFRRSAPALCTSLEELHGRLKKAASGDIIHVPELEEMGGATGVLEVHKLLRADDVAERDKEGLERLQMASGEALPVHRGNHGDVKLLDFRETLPKDLAPVLVLDASGRCRTTYDLMESHRDNLVRLPSSAKDYSTLEIGVWLKGSGKASYLKDDNEVLIRGVADKILERPDEDWLIVHHKHHLPRFKKRLFAHLGGEVTGTLHFLTWGNHHGTNAFKDVPNVIISGLHNLPPEVYEARVRLCAGMDRTKPVTAAQRKAMALGEHLHNVLQALCRATVRGTQGEGVCLPCRAYIIAAKQSGLWEELPRLFPNCQLEKWQPKGSTKLTKRIQQTLAVIGLWDDDEIAYVDLALAIEVDKRDFSKHVARDPRFKDEVAKRGYVEADISRETARGARTAKGIVREVIFPSDPGSSYSAVDPD